MCISDLSKCPIGAHLHAIVFSSNKKGPWFYFHSNFPFYKRIPHRDNFTTAESIHKKHTAYSDVIENDHSIMNKCIFPLRIHQSGLHMKRFPSKHYHVYFNENDEHDAGLMGLSPASCSCLLVSAPFVIFWWHNKTILIISYTGLNFTIETKRQSTFFHFLSTFSFFFIVISSQ